MIESIYIASNFAHRDDLRGIIPEFERQGVAVTSSWIFDDSHIHSWNGPQSASKDLADIQAADALLLFIDRFGESNGRGKWFEFGYALALGKPIFLVGQDTGCIFTRLERDGIYRHPDWQSALQGLKAGDGSVGNTRLTRFHANALDGIAAEIHRLNAKWWVDLGTGKPKERNVGELLMLAVSELGEALEGHRKNLGDEHLPEYPSFSVEIADCMIRLFDTASVLCPGFGDILVAKCEYNAIRADHQLESRLAAGGKRY